MSFQEAKAASTSAEETNNASTGSVPPASGPASSSESMTAAQLKKSQGTEDVAGDVDTEIDNVCMVCLDFEPGFVLTKCGHFGICSKCRTGMYLRQNNSNQRRKIPKTKDKWKALFEKYIICPYCRTSTKAVHRSRHLGNVYSCG